MYEIYLKINYSTRFLCIAMKDLSFISTMNVDKDDILLDKSLITLFKQNNKHFLVSVLIQDLRFFYYYYFLNGMLWGRELLPNKVNVTVSFGFFFLQNKLQISITNLADANNNQFHNF